MYWQDPLEWEDQIMEERYGPGSARGVQALVAAMMQQRGEGKMGFKSDVPKPREKPPEPPEPRQPKMPRLKANTEALRLAMLEQIERNAASAKFPADSVAITPEGESVAAPYVYGGEKSFTADLPELKSMARNLFNGPSGYSPGDDLTPVRTPQYLKENLYEAKQIPDQMAKDIARAISESLVSKDIAEELKEIYPELLQMSVKRDPKLYAELEALRSKEGRAAFRDLKDPFNVLPDAIALYMRDPDSVRHTKTGEFIRRLVNNSKLGKYVKFAQADDNAFA